MRKYHCRHSSRSPWKMAWNSFIAMQWGSVEKTPALFCERFFKVSSISICLLFGADNFFYESKAKTSPKWRQFNLAVSSHIIIVGFVDIHWQILTFSMRGIFYLYIQFILQDINIQYIVSYSFDIQQEENIQQCMIFNIVLYTLCIQHEKNIPD